MLLCSSYQGYLDPFTKPQAGTWHILGCGIKALWFPATQQGLTDQTLVHAQVFIQKLWCLHMCVWVQACTWVSWKTKKASCLTSHLLLPCLSPLQRENPWVCRSASDCSGCLTVASLVVCGSEGHSSCSHHSGLFSWIKCDLLTRKCKQLRLIGQRADTRISIVVEGMWRMLLYYETRTPQPPVLSSALYESSENQERARIQLEISNLTHV